MFLALSLLARSDFSFLLLMDLLPQEEFLSDKLGNFNKDILLKNWLEYSIPLEAYTH